MCARSVKKLEWLNSPWWREFKLTLNGEGCRICSTESHSARADSARTNWNVALSGEDCHRNLIFLMDPLKIFYVFNIRTIDL